MTKHIGCDATVKRTKENSQVQSRKRKRPRRRPFRLLDLPAELRNCVYEQVAWEQRAYATKKGHLVDLSGLLEVSHQIRDEYYPILSFTTRRIEARAYNFDFRHIVTLLNRLSSTELDSMSTFLKATHKKFRVTVHLPNKPPKLYYNDELLRRWLKRAGQAHKKGALIDFRYEFISGPDFASTPWAIEREKWEDFFDEMIETCTVGRMRVEAMKMKQAFLRDW